MIATNAVYDNLIADGANIEWQVLNGTNVFSVVNLIDGRLSSTIFPRISIGNVISSQLDLTLWNVSVDKEQPLVLQFRASFNGGESVSAWNTKGTYYIDTVESSPYSENTKITAFDALIKTEIVYQQTGSWTAKTASALVNEIAGKIGVPIASSTSAVLSATPITLTASPNIGTEGTTQREMLSFVAAMYGGNFRINASNQLELVLAYNTPTNIAPVGDAVSDFDASAAETIGKVRVWTDDNISYFPAPGLPIITHKNEPILTHLNQPILAHASQFIEEWEAIDGQVLDVSLPFYASEEIANRIYGLLNGVSYIPYTANFAFIDPKYEVGDGIQIKDITSVIANQDMNITPLAPSAVNFGKTEVLNNKYKYKPSFERTTTYAIGEVNKAIASIPDEIAEKVENATTLITGGFGGFIKFTYLSDGTPSELLVMDSDSEDTATNIIRLNKNGLGFSTDGGKTYANAWTIDGNLVADFITTGTLNADLIRTGIIQDVSGANSWNLNTGKLITTSGSIGNMSISDESIYGVAAIGNGTIEISADGVITTSTDAQYPRTRSIIADGYITIEFYNEDTKAWETGFSLEVSEYIDMPYASMAVGNSGENILMLFDTSASVNGDLSVSGALDVEGAKNRLIDTENYGKRRLSAYETTTPYFGDIGEGQISENGEAYIFLDPVFSETIDDTNYQVFLQPYGAGECYISDRAGAYFVVKGSPGLKFGFEIKARQIGASQKRLEKKENRPPKQTDYGTLAINHLKQIQKERHRQ